MKPALIWGGLFCLSLFKVASYLNVLCLPTDPGLPAVGKLVVDSLLPINVICPGMAAS